MSTLWVSHDNYSGRSYHRREPHYYIKSRRFGSQTTHVEVLVMLGALLLNHESSTLVLAVHNSYIVWSYVFYLVENPWHKSHQYCDVCFCGWSLQSPLNSRSFQDAVMVFMKLQNRVITSQWVLASRSWRTNSKRVPMQRGHPLLMLCNTPNARLCLQHIDKCVLAILSDTYSTQATRAGISKPSCVRMADPNALRHGWTDLETCPISLPWSLVHMWWLWTSSQSIQR